MKVTVRDGNSCPPCTGDCNQGRTCPAYCSGGCEGGTRDCDCAGALVDGHYVHQANELPEPTEPLEHDDGLNLWRSLGSALGITALLVFGVLLLVEALRMLAEAAK